MGGRRRRPLPRHLRARAVQPRDDDHGRPAGPQRGPRQPAQLARAEAEDRGRGRDPPRQRRAARLPPRLRHRHGDGHPRAALPRPRRARDGAAQPALREHGALPPGGDRVDAHAGELVGLGRHRVRDRRPRDQRRRRALPPARGTPPGPRLAAHVRPRDHRPARRDAPVEHLRRAGRAHARLPRRRAARGRALAVSDGGLHPAGRCASTSSRASRRGSRSSSRSTPRATARSTSR